MPRAIRIRVSVGEERAVEVDDAIAFVGHEESVVDPSSCTA